MGWRVVVLLLLLLGITTVNSSLSTISSLLDPSNTACDVRVVRPYALNLVRQMLCLGDPLGVNVVTIQVRFAMVSAFAPLKLLFFVSFSLLFDRTCHLSSS